MHLIGDIMIQLYNGDCLELMKNIPDSSVDLVLTDPPYGVITKSTHDLKGWQNKSIKWDSCISAEKIFAEIDRVLRPNGKCILFSQEPYTSELITKQIPSLPFSYRAVWVKNNAGNVLGCKQNMVSYFEDICVFSKVCPKHDFDKKHPLRDYFMKEKEKCLGVNFNELLGNNMASHYFTNGSQFTFPTKKNYEKLQKTGFFKEDYEKLKEVHTKWQQDNIDKMNALYPSVFNLWQGGKQKSNVLEYQKDSGSYHPTQKPVKLLEDLIQTYSNEGNTVLDFTMGSGSTGVACINTNRNFIGIELDKGYFDIAEKRINEAQNI